MPTVRVNGQDTGVDADDAREAFRRLGEAIRDAAEAADPDDDVIEVEVPDTSDIDPEPEPEDDPDDFDFDETGYLAPGTDPDSIPPHLLPYVRGINNRDIRIAELEKRLTEASLERRRLSDFQNAVLTGRTNVLVRNRN
ncbi:hypothetical protein L1D16_21710 [Vibrio sp. Isolate31]|uniref:hypothetical protein n=1 Tax=unclassified Vibrio TaxID=2614977 RepID=UPI001EFE0D2C|nr:MULTISPECIES: hypothetical protein [unclassified Vibrio]MCG9555309.1 hypothetical protein [Vibrio sp. Isolate32]MCG9603339.1 hypothetical protein [Vibrio sp. Isolate31]